MPSRPSPSSDPPVSGALIGPEGEGDRHRTPAAWVAFDLADGTRVAVDAQFVRQVIPVAPATPLPGAPAHVPGLVLVGAVAVPELDLGVFFGLARAARDGGGDDRDAERTADHRRAHRRMLVLDDGRFEVATCGTRLELRHAPSGGARARPPQLVPSSVARYAMGELDGDRPVAILNLRVLLEGARIRAS